MSDGIPLHRRPDDDPRRNWYDESLRLAAYSHRQDVDLAEPRKQRLEAEERLRVAEFTPERMDDLSSPELQRIAHALHANVWALIEELRKRHADTVSEELVDERVRALEAQLREAKAEAFRQGERAWEAEDELARLRTLLGIDDGRAEA